MAAFSLDNNIGAGLDIIQMLSPYIKSVNNEVEGLKALPKYLLLVSVSYFYRKGMQKEAKQMSIANGDYFIMHKAYSDVQSMKKPLEAIMGMNPRDRKLNFMQKLVLAELKGFIRVIFASVDSFKDKLDQYDAAKTAKSSRFKKMTRDEVLEMIPDAYLM